MNTKTVAADQIKILEKKLKATIESRGALEEDFSHQSNLFIPFISKLSLVPKGINLELDNRLAQLRVLLHKSAPISEIELKIAQITKLLQRHAVANEKNITQLHEQFNIAGKNLQNTKGLSDDIRRKLRTLLKETESTKDNITLYIPLLNQLIELYDISLHSNDVTSQEKSSSESQLPMAAAQSTEDRNSDISNELIEQISACLSRLNLSSQHTKELLTIKKKLLNDTNQGAVLKHFIEIFDVIVADYQYERKSAKKFFNTLNDTLTTVQNAVKKTLSKSSESQSTNNTITDKLQSQLVELGNTTESAVSLEGVKVNIHSKLKSITATLDTKGKFEQLSHKELTSQLNQMAEKVKNLEEQSAGLSKKLSEQKRKSMQDALTKLNNRASFDEHFSKEMVRFHYEPFDLSLAVIDIDDFKHINDNYGHTAGDKTLQVIANTLQNEVSNDAFVARYGGEEFIIIYSNQQETALIGELERINNKVARLPFKFKSNRVSITLSIGVTHINKNDNIHTAFERADKAMYQAKSQGKNQVIYLK